MPSVRKNKIRKPIWHRLSQSRWSNLWHSGRPERRAGLSIPLCANVAFGSGSLVEAISGIVSEKSSKLDRPMAVDKMLARILMSEDSDYQNSADRLWIDIFASSKTSHVIVDKPSKEIDNTLLVIYR